MENRRKVFLSLNKSVLFCLDLSWRASRLYTLTRLGIVVISPAIPIALSFFAKEFLNISTAIMALYENRLKFENLQNFLAYENKVCDGEKVLTEPIKNIEFSEVSFRYTNHDPLVLNNVSFKVCDRETAVIVGINGSGKSTLLKLLLRMYDPTEGAIYVNGENIKNFTLASLRAFFQFRPFHLLASREKLITS